MIHFACPLCKVVLQVPEQQAGGKVACPKCGQRLQIPVPPGKSQGLGNSSAAVVKRPTSPVLAAAGTPPLISKPGGAHLSAPPDRNRVPWYYQRGGKRFGPVSFA